MFAVHDLDWIEWNPVEGECVEETQEKDTACGFQQATVDKVASKVAVEEWPGAIRVLEGFSLTNAEHNHMINEVDEVGRDLAEVVQEWLDTNEATWKAWADAAMM